MLAYALRRLLGAIPTIFVIITLAFFLMRIAPGGPFDRERVLEPTVMANISKAFHLDRPVYEQYVIYLGNLMRGDLGPSFVYRDFTVGELLAAGLPISMLLGGCALLLALLVGGTLGIIAALKQNSPIDYLVVAVATFGITIPNFVVAPVLSLAFGVWLNLLPAGGWDGASPAHMILPVITLALPQIAVIARLIRGAMLEALRSDHVRTARAYGLPARLVVIVHSLRGASLPVVSYLGPAAAALLTGSVVVETIFGIPGVGRYFVQGALNRDYTLVMGTVVIIAVFVVVFNLVVDLLYAAIDPRVRYD
ncbi:oligopeptide ABC transporter permease OppB [Acuticoccus kandeliae]|uniref:oligopeptide ABC transporter permease OppB n=1 Tax=Acuticoccus kandeliae TaxID=2073160 RepID=UPI000D3E0AE2|nr:oligopeptide ABC transporter permease OppB [Acuticoccus kandeliae]